MSLCYTNIVNSATGQSGLNTQSGPSTKLIPISACPNRREGESISHYDILCLLIDSRYLENFTIYMQVQNTDVNTGQLVHSSLAVSVGGLLTSAISSGTTL